VLSRLTVSNRALCFAALLGLLISQASAAESTPTKLVVLGDRTGGHRDGVFSQGLGQILELDPDLVLSVGDLIEGYSSSVAVIDAEWDSVDSKLAELAAPLIVAPGNHDISNQAMAFVWKKRRGDSFASHRLGALHVLVLNTEDPPTRLPDDIVTRHHRLSAAMEANALEAQARVLDAVRGTEKRVLPGSAKVSAAQVTFALEALNRNSDAESTILLMHKPLWKHAPTIWKQLVPHLPANSLAIAGHEHYYEAGNHDGIETIIMGTTGGVWLQDGPGRVDHLLLVDGKTLETESVRVETEFDAL